MKRALPLLALAALAACSKAGEEAAATGTPTVAAPAPAKPDEPSPSRLPDRVLIAWAKAMSVKDWDSAYRYWGEAGAGSGLTLAQFRARWGKLADPQFEIGRGKTEAAAGSLFYSAPIILIDGKRRVPGQIVLRRTNNLPGASAEQLRWHIESLSIEP